MRRLLVNKKATAAHTPSQSSTMSKKISARGAEIEEGQRSQNKQHMSDVSGAKGCYFCWLGEYSKCEAHCQKVHKVRSAANDTRGASVDVFDAVTPYFTRMHQQNTSIFDETASARALSSAVSRSINAAEALQNAVIRDNRTIPSSDTMEFSSGDSVENSALYDRRSAASRRHPTLKSFHEPKPVISQYKYPRGAMLIPISPYTVVSVTPSTHTYGAHHQRNLDSGDAMWTGSLVKECRVAQDERSRAVAERMRAGRSVTPPPSRSSSSRPGAERLRSMTPGNIGWQGSAQLSTTASHTGPTNQRYAVQHNVVGSHIMSGVYQSAADLPLPSVFDSIVYR